MRTLLTSSQKGGVGKTTTSINLAALAGGSGMRVLLVDCDPASGVASSLSTDADAPISHLPGVEIISLDDGECGDLEALRKLLSRVESAGRSGDFDLAILGSPPFLGEWLGSLLDASDEVILVGVTPRNEQDRPLLVGVARDDG
jgi:cellulose biosynthesis protein BcsQ